jgi:VWFA-related protein
MRKGPLLIIATLLWFSVTVRAQEKKPSPTPKPVEADDVVRVSTELVQTDVMVLDKDGKFVSGLQREQFELLIDGKPQPITFWESVVAGSRNERAALKAARDNKPPPERYVEAGSEQGRTIFFFVNDLHLAPGSLALTHKTINYFLDRMLGPNDQVAITSASGQIGFLQQLTNNPVVLRAALERLKYVPTTARDGERPYISDYAAYLIVEQNDRALFDYFVEQTQKLNNMPGLGGARSNKAPIPQGEIGLAPTIVERRTKAIVRDSQYTVKVALSSLVNLMSTTARLPGRKLVFFISDGFLPNFTGSDFTFMMGRATGAANRSGVVIYSFDARGLSNDASLDASLSGGSDPSGILQSRVSGERTFSQEALHALAADTGGRAMLNSNALEDGIARALDETSRYYLLAWRPETEAQRASNFSKIKVTIAGRPDLKVQLRRGYLGPPAEPAKAKVEPVTVQLEKTDDLGVTESSGEEIRTALAVGYKQTSAGNMQLASSVQVSAQSPDNSSGKLDVNVLGAVFDSKGKAVGSFKQRIEVSRTPARAAPVYATVNHQVELPPGLYQVRTFAYERGTTHLNGAMEWIEIPKLKPGAFSLSSLYVGEITDTGGSQVTVNASGRFARSSRMRFTTYVYNAAHNAGPPQLTAQIKVLRGEQAVLTPPEMKVSTDKQTNLASITYAGEFPLSSLPPGSYVLEVNVTDKTAPASASQRIRFTVY